MSENGTGNYIYLIREREFLRLGEETYKIGKTLKENPNDRIKNYPKGSELILVLKVLDCNICETRLINRFKKEFIQKKEYGKEYFEGSTDEMIEIIISLRNCMEKYDKSYVKPVKKEKIQESLPQEFLDQFEENSLKYIFTGTDSKIYITIRCFHLIYENWCGVKHITPISKELLSRKYQLTKEKQVRARETIDGVVKEGKNYRVVDIKKFTSEYIETPINEI
jgi:hypothetical protein